MRSCCSRSNTSRTAGCGWIRACTIACDFDCGEYRATRLAELKLSARVAAQRVRETGQPFQFNPMSSRERRIVHLELSGAAGVRTESEGSGDRRQLVIYPATPPPRDSCFFRQECSSCAASDWLQSRTGRFPRGAKSPA